MRKKLFYFVVALIIYPYICMGQTIASMDSRPTDVEHWISSHFAQGTVPPFSFEYGGKPSKEFIKDWAYSAKPLKSDDQHEVRYCYTYQDPASGLKVDCDVKGFTDSQAVEWVLHFTNTGSGNTPEIANVCVSDIVFRYDRPGNFRLHYANGSFPSKADFAPRLKELTSGENLYMRPDGGRSSHTAFPFFNIESPSGQGVMVAIGWTGTWFSDVRCTDAQSIQLKSGIERLKAYLYPKETIRTSSVCLLFWQGNDRMVGHNQFRRFILAHHTRKVDGKPAQYPFCKGFNYGDPTPCNEYTCLTADYAIALVKRYKQFKLLPEVFWLDAGWYDQSADVANNKNWANTVGNWTVDSVRFPEGLKPIADEIHKVGSKFMVWFEPERVYYGSAWAIEHPEYMLERPGADACLVNLGNPKACRWMSEYIGDFIEENNIDYYRQDFNIEPAGFWEANDEPGRQGICEIKYIEGLYAFWDYLLERFPNLLIDNCASGGRRLDLETTTRSAPLWRTDYSYGEPDGYQCHTYGLNFYLPLHGTGAWGVDKYTCRSSLSSAVTFNWKITEAGVSIYDMRDRQAEFEELRPYFLEDYYPLSGIDNTTAENTWLAYQLYRKSDDSGYIVAFRRKECPDKDCKVKLFGMNLDKTYLLINKDTGDSIRKTGKELSEGLTLTLDEPRSSMIIRYQSDLSEPVHDLVVGEKTDAVLQAIGAEFDPHFLSQNVTRNDGAKEKDWKNIIEKRIKDMDIHRLRVMVLPQWYEPENDNDDPDLINWDKFTFNSPEMQSLYRELDLAQQQQMEVTLTLWGAPDKHFLAGRNSGNWVVAPESNEEWSENFSALIQYLIKEKKYTCIKEITPVNEPDWSFLVNGKRASTAKYIEMCKALDRRFKKDGIRELVDFSLSDNSDGGIGTHKYLAACTRELADVADVFNSHTYIFGYETPNSTILDWERQNYELSKSAGKPHFVGEFGGNQCVGAARQKDINLYERGVLMVRIAINLLNAGASGVSYWSLIDQYYGKNDSYEGMQQLGLWKYVKNAYAQDTCYENMTVDYEVRPQYFAYSLLTRFIRPGAEVYPISTPDEFYAGTAIKNKDGKWVYVFANGTAQEKKIKISNKHVGAKGTYEVYKYAQNALPKGDKQISPEKRAMKGGNEFFYTLPTNSVILLREK